MRLLSSVPAIIIALVFFSCNSETPKAPTTTAAAKDTVAVAAAPVSPVADTTGEVEDDVPLPPLRPASSYKNIVVLRTDEGLDEKYDPDRGDYDDSSLVSPTDTMYEQLATYGVAHMTWVAPKGWTGWGLHAGNGGTGVHLYPPGGSDSVGTRIEYHIEPSCGGCQLIEAGRYFKNARDEWNRGLDGGEEYYVRPPKGIRITRVSSKIVTFSLPPRNGLVPRGVAYYYDVNGDRYFSEMDIWLPEQDSVMMNYLIDRQVAHYKAYKPW